MNENLRSILTGTAGLSVVAVVALLQTILRRPMDGDLVGRERMAPVFPIGLAAHCLHFMEEFVTRFQDRFPALLGLPAWPENFEARPFLLHPKLNSSNWPIFLLPLHQFA